MRLSREADNTYVLSIMVLAYAFLYEGIEKRKGKFAKTTKEPSLHQGRMPYNLSYLPAYFTEEGGKLTISFVIEKISVLGSTVAWKSLNGKYKAEA